MMEHIEILNQMFVSRTCLLILLTLTSTLCLPNTQLCNAVLTAFTVYDLRVSTWSSLVCALKVHNSITFLFSNGGDVCSSTFTSREAQKESQCLNLNLVNTKNTGYD